MFVKFELLQTNILVIALLIGQAVAQQPSWIKKRPLLDSYYIGIGMASKLQSGNSYRQKAKNSALSDLASEIAISISSEVIRVIVEQAGFIEDQIRSEIRAQTQASLEGYELVATWENDREYWVYYRLSKDRFKKQKQLKKQKAVSQSLHFLTKGHSSVEAREISNALSSYFQALNPLRPYIDDPLEVSYNHRKIYLREEIFTSLQNLLGNITLTPDQERMQFKLFPQQNRSVEVAAFYRAPQAILPIAHLPLRFSFLHGAGKIEETVRSDASGVAICHLKNLALTYPTHALQAELDLSAYTSEDDIGKINYALLRNLSIPKTTITLEISAPTVFVDVLEENLGETLAVPMIQPVLKAVLLENGFMLAENKTEADYHIHLIAKSRKGSESHNLSTAFIDITIFLSEGRSGKEIYRNALHNINGVNLGYRKAGLAAFQNACERIKQDIFPALLTKILQGH